MGEKKNKKEIKYDGVIRIPPRKYDPKLDIQSKQFDLKKYEEAHKHAAEKMKEIQQRISSIMKETYNPNNMSMIFEAMCESLERTANNFSEQIKLLQCAQKSHIWHNIRENITFIAENAETIESSLIEFEQLEPFLETELKKPEYNGKTLKELFESCETDKKGKPLPESLWRKALTASRIEKEKQQQLPAVVFKKASIVEYPLDKMNSTIWNLLEKDTSGQIELAVEKHGSDKELSILYSIDFDNLDKNIAISKRLTPFDKRIYIVVSALYNAGNEVITLTQIHYAMGNIKRPSKYQLKKINNTIKKMYIAKISVDNTQESTAYNYVEFKYSGSLLPLERIEAIVNGQLVDTAIHIFREPPIMSFAKQRKQITTIPVKLLQSPLNKTDDNLKMEDYLIERISRITRIKTKKKSERILFKTLYEKTGITTKKQKQRAPEKLKKYLYFYQKENFIERYTIQTDGITIYCKNPISIKNI